ncbi:MAG: thiopurine S-methyltransferase [Symploca sp. SIO1B1]|nr:thiopurine S-methyltransferase [Symploca sp. SIO1B1]
MDTNFWQQTWKNHDIGFHKSEANPVLVKYFSELSLRQGSRVFLPLCGKTLDIAWLLSQGYRVAGAELVEMAIEQLFVELEVVPKILEVGNLKQYSAENLDIFVGNIFELSGKVLGSVEAIYDRAALVALPEEMRRGYTAHLTEITNKAPQLLVTYEYDQNLMAGPPFSISNEEVNQHYGAHYDLTLIVSNNVPGGFKGKYAATENVWSLCSTY